MTQAVVDDDRVVKAPAPAAETVEQPWPPAPLAWYSVVMISMVAVFGSLDNGALGLMVNSIKRDMHLSDVQIGLLVGGAYSAGYFLVGLPMARVSDSGKRKLILPGALAVFSFGAALCGLAQNFWQFAVCRLIIGAGISVKPPVSVSLIPDLIPRKHLQRAFSIYNFAVHLSHGVALILGGLLLGWLAQTPPIYVPVLGELRDWQLVFLIFGLPGVIMAVIMVLTMPEPARRGRKVQTGRRVPVRELVRFLFKSPSTAVLIPILLAAGVGAIEGTGLATWRPAFYERTFGWLPQDFGPIVGGSAFITVPLGLFLGNILSEHLSKVGRHDAHLWVVFIAHVISIPLTVAAPLMPNIWLAMGCSMGATVVNMMGAPAQLTAMQIVTPNEFRAQVNALYMFTIGVIGVSFGPLVVGLLTDYVFSEADLRYAMVTVAAIGGPVAMVLYWMAIKPYGAAHRRFVEAGN